MDELPRSHWLAFPRVLWLSLAVALVLALPTVGLGFFGDDFLHLLVLEYLGLYTLYGYGARGSGSYLDPLGEPGRYLLGALARIPALVGGLVLELPTGLWGLDERARPTLVGLGVLKLGLFGWLLRATWPQLTDEERRHCRWLLLGAALALVPMAATAPSQRLLLVPGVGRVGQRVSL